LSIVCTRYNGTYLLRWTSSRLLQGELLLDASKRSSILAALSVNVI
jgi:hypothetical protein